MLTHILNYAWIIFQVITALFLAFPVISWLAYLIIRGRNPEKPANPGIETDFAVLITAYKEISNIPHLVQTLLKQNYSNYLIYIIADNCPDFNLEFDKNKVMVLRPHPILENQVKSHFYAISHFQRTHDHLVIIDSDNLVAPDFLTELNKSFVAGYQAVQGVRKAKNLDTPYACLDAANEIYYFYYNRKIMFEIGSSSMLAGSGMAFSVRLYRECMENVNSSGAGFDKILQKEIINRGIRIAFSEKAIVFDEKTSQPTQLVKQRARWNNTWFRYFTLGTYLIGQGVRKGSVNRFLFGFLIVRPPLFLLLSLSFIILVVNFFINPTAVLIWIFLFLIFISGFIIALINSDTDHRIYKSLIHIPKFVFLQLLSLLKTGKANQISVATTHYHNKEIEKM